MKKNHSLVVLLVLCFSILSFSSMKDQPHKKVTSDSNPVYSFAVTSKKLEANNISTWFRSNGSFNRDPTTGNSGFEWPKGAAKFARYASGLWLGGVVNGSILVAIAEYDYEYLPGYVDNNGDPQGSDDPNYRIFSFSDDDSVDFGAWRTIASQQGAYLNSSGNPFRMGSQTMFYSYTDGYPAAHTNNAGSTLPLKAQILQTNWAYINVNLRDVAFTEFRIINRSNQVWNNFYISVWTDDDLGNATDDAVGIDTASEYKLGYTYNFTNNDTEYGAAPPAVGYTILRGPVVPSIGDTVRYYSPPGSNNLIVKPNMKEIKLSSFNTYINGDPTTGDPSNFQETYYNLQGLKRDGSPWRNPFTNEISKFPYSGAPEIPTGWVMSSGSDRRFLMTMGPINMVPGDTQSVICAQVIARGTSNLNSITRLRQLAHHVQGIYYNNFQSVLNVNNYSNLTPEKYSLHQNYPNPFNPSTKIRFDIPSNSSGQLSNVKLTVYNSLGNLVKTLVNEKMNSGSYETEFRGEDLSSGVYFYKLETEGFIQTKRMVFLK
ncbi:MAG: T9SS type A sorting domain-containing protein [Ignavibacteria bacterium]|nr:T9SS type A sorting domain-containing protein [Ignavibacteria bacterium]